MTIKKIIIGAILGGFLFFPEMVLAALCSAFDFVYVLPGLEHREMHDSSLSNFLQIFMDSIPLYTIHFLIYKTVKSLFKKDIQIELTCILVITALVWMPADGIPDFSYTGYMAMFVAAQFIVHMKASAFIDNKINIESAGVKSLAAYFSSIALGFGVSILLWPFLQSVF